MLNVSKLSASYGGIAAVEDISLEVRPGQFVALLGSNGAGKSTTLRTIAGLHPPKSGSILLGDTDITGLKTHRVVRHGLALVPEGRMVVGSLTVEENLLMSAYAKRTRDSDPLEDIYSLFPRLKERRHQVAGLLSGGEQQMLAVGRALATSPDVILLDEPSMGLAPSIVDIVLEAIITLHDSGQSILMVEQNAALVLPICDYAYVLQRGRIVAGGTPESLRDSKEIAEAYLG